MTDFFMFIPLFAFLSIFIIPLVIGFYVYKDAQQRGMNALLWTLIAVFVPSFIGFIIYLVVRADYGGLRCARCNSVVSKDFASCPNCGVQLKAACESCNQVLESHWKVCPSCSQPVHHTQTISAPIKENDKGLVKVIVFIVLFPLILFIIMILSALVYSM